MVLGGGWGLGGRGEGGWVYFSEKERGSWRKRSERVRLEGEEEGAAIWM